MQQTHQDAGEVIQMAVDAGCVRSEVERPCHEGVAAQAARTPLPQVMAVCGQWRRWSLVSWIATSQLGDRHLGGVLPHFHGRFEKG